MHHDRERQPELRDAQRVVAVRRASGLLRVVAELRPLLVPVEGLHRRIEVRDVVLRHHVLQETQVLAPDPRQGLAVRDGREVAPHGVARHEPPDAEQLRRRRVAVEAVAVPEPSRSGRGPRVRCCSSAASGTSRRGGRRSRPPSRTGSAARRARSRSSASRRPTSGRSRLRASRFSAHLRPVLCYTLSRRSFFLSCLVAESIARTTLFLLSKMDREVKWIGKWISPAW